MDESTYRLGGCKCRRRGARLPLARASGCHTGGLRTKHGPKRWSEQDDETTTCGGHWSEGDTPICILRADPDSECPTPPSGQRIGDGTFMNQTVMAVKSRTGRSPPPGRRSDILKNVRMFRPPSLAVRLTGDPRESRGDRGERQNRRRPPAPGYSDILKNVGMSAGRRAPAAGRGNGARWDAATVAPPAQRRRRWWVPMRGCS
jgi:hypothetical protein